SFAGALLDRHPRKVIATAQHPALPDHDDMYAGAAWHYRGRDNIHVAGLGIDILLVLDAPQLAYLVPQLRCPLEVEVLARPFHCLGQLVGQGATAPLEKHNGMADILAVFLFAYEADTRRLSPLD